MDQTTMMSLSNLNPEPWKEANVSNNALDIQVGGGHYKKLSIQPVEYTVKNNLSYLQGNVIKYVTRYKDKNGKEDVIKAKHYLDLILELEYGDTE